MTNSDSGSEDDNAKSVELRGLFSQVGTIELLRLHLTYRNWDFHSVSWDSVARVLRAFASAPVSSSIRRIRLSCSHHATYLAQGDPSDSWGAPQTCLSSTTSSHPHPHPHPQESTGSPLSARSSSQPTTLMPVGKRCSRSTTRCTPSGSGARSRGCTSAESRRCTCTGASLLFSQSCLHRDGSGV